MPKIQQAQMPLSNNKMPEREPHEMKLGGKKITLPQKVPISRRGWGETLNEQENHLD